jgi:hypothetical protein
VPGCGAAKSRCGVNSSGSGAKIGGCGVKLECFRSRVASVTRVAVVLRELFLFGVTILFHRAKVEVCKSGVRLFRIESGTPVEKVDPKLQMSSVWVG